MIKMSASVTSAFPSNAQEAIALLYLQNQNLEGKAPEEIQEMFYNAYYALRKDYVKKIRAGWFKANKETL